MKINAGKAYDLYKPLLLVQKKKLLLLSAFESRTFLN